MKKEELIKIENNNIDSLRQKLSDKLKQFEKDKTNRIGMMMELEESKNFELAIDKLFNYLDNPNTSKTRNDIIEAIERIVETT